MKVVKQTSKSLVLQSSRTINLGQMGWGLFLVGSVLVRIFLHFKYSGVEEIACQRIEQNQVNCELIQSRYMGLKKGQKKSLEQVKEVRVKPDQWRGNLSTNYLLNHQFLEIALYNKKPEDVSRINDFVKNPESTSLTIKHDNRRAFIWAFPFLLVVVVSGFFLIGSSVDEAIIVETYTFDKTFGTLTKTRKILLITQVNEYPLREIIDVRVEAGTDRDGVTKGYKISLELTGDKRLTFLSLFSKTKKEEVQKLANTIARFLNVPKSR